VGVTMRTCDIKKCVADGLYRTRKYVFCERHKEWAQKIAKSDGSRYMARREYERDEATSKLARDNHVQGTEGKRTRQRSF
jgi:hypothetical protein